MNKIIRRFSENPKKLLIIDAIGAFATLLLLVIIAKCSFGIPTTYFVVLVVIALLIFIYTSTCFLIAEKVNLEKTVKLTPDFGVN